MVEIKCINPRNGEILRCAFERCGFVCDYEKHSGGDKDCTYIDVDIEYEKTIVSKRYLIFKEVKTVKRLKSVFTIWKTDDVWTLTISADSEYRENVIKAAKLLPVDFPLVVKFEKNVEKIVAPLAQ